MTYRTDDRWQSASLTQGGSSVGASGSSRNITETPAWRLWDLMIKIYANRWVTKNGNRPNALWETQTGSMTADQLSRVARACVQRCAAGNSWPPDFAEFVQLVAECGGGLLGLSAGDVVTEYRRWRDNAWRYDGADEFPWRHTVLYHICLELQRATKERNLTRPEHEKLAGALLQRWEKKLAAGYSVPPVKKRIAPPEHPAGPTPAQQMHEEFLRRRAAGRT